MLAAEAHEAVKEFTGKWWIFLLTGLAWFVVSLVVLRMDLGSVTAVGVLLGIVFLVSAAEEVFIASVRSSWAWARVLLAALFFLGAIWCFVRPFDAFWSLAAAIGFLFVFKGALDMVESIMTRPINEVWWLGLVVGILEVFLGFWASQQYIPTRATLLLLWVGLYAMFRGVSEIVLAFEVRHLNA